MLFLTQGVHGLFMKLEFTKWSVSLCKVLHLRHFKPWNKAEWADCMGTSVCCSLSALTSPAWRKQLSVWPTPSELPEPHHTVPLAQRSYNSYSSFPFTASLFWGDEWVFLLPNSSKFISNKGAGKMGIEQFLCDTYRPDSGWLHNPKLPIFFFLLLKADFRTYFRNISLLQCHQSKGNILKIANISWHQLRKKSDWMLWLKKLQSNSEQQHCQKKITQADPSSEDLDVSITKPLSTQDTENSILHSLQGR